MSERVVITEPGIYPDLPEDQYHADCVPGGSLSSTGARAILPPGTPKQYDWDRHRTVHKPEWDFGSAFHSMILGTGPEIVIIEAPNYQTKDAREQRDEAYGRGHLPLLPSEHEHALAMVMTLHRHPVAGPLFAKGTGAAEQSLFWVDERTGVWCRGRLDWMKPAATGGRLIIADLKTTTAADDESLSKTIARFGYHQQAEWYLTGVRTLGIHPDPAYVLVFVEKTSPHQVRVVQLDAYALQLAKWKNQRALDIYKACTDTGEWPGYPTDITTISLPAWAERTETEEYLPNV